MAIEGELAVSIDWDGRQVQRVAVRSTRPDAVARLVRGRAPGDAVDLVARLHSLCACAQGAAAATALDAATGIEVPVRKRAARAAATRLETMQEHCTRIGIDWAQAMGSAPLFAMVRAVRTALAPALATLLGHALRGGPACDADEVESTAIAAIAPLAEPTLLGASARAWLARSDAEALQEWIAGDAAPARWYARLTRVKGTLPASDVALMPIVTAASIRACVLPGWSSDSAFAQRPHWDGAAVETGAVARMAAHPLLASLIARDGVTVAVRLVARLTELASLLVRDTPAAALASFDQGGCGYAIAHTARGLLLHRAAMEGGRVRDYAIVAPTEWNFRPEGAFVRTVRRFAGDDADAIRRDAMLVACAIDPCVALHVEVAHA
jgi:Ni,Fe-hydrogenase I large subunit